MKIKIKDFNGIFTNNDENDNRLELCTDSENFFHKRGFLEIDPRNLAEDTNLPDPNTLLPGYTSWIWETGIYTTLSSDILTTADTPVPSKHNVLVLIAKHTEGNTYHRLVYLYDITDSEGWYELSNKGNYTQIAGDPVIDIENHNTVDFRGSAFSTAIDGDTHFQVEDGRLKIYMPHDTFWLGKIDRKIWVTDTNRRWPITDTNGDITYPHFDYEGDYWYIDRVTEDWKYYQQDVAVSNTINESQVPRNPNAGVTECAKGHTVLDKQIRRSGLYYDMVPNTESGHVVGGRPINIGDPHDQKVRKESTWANFRCVRVSIYDESGFPVKNPRLPFPQAPEVWLFALDAERTTNSINSGSGDWSLPSAPNYADIYIHFHGAMATNFRLASGADVDTISGYVAYDEGEVRVWNVESKQYTGGTSFSIPLKELYTHE